MILPFFPSQKANLVAFRSLANLLANSGTAGMEALGAALAKSQAWQVQAMDRADPDLISLADSSPAHLFLVHLLLMVGKVRSSSCVGQ